MKKYLITLVLVGFFHALSAADYVFNSRSAMNVSASSNDTCTLLGYYALGDDGGGKFFFDTSLGSSAENGGTIYYNGINGCWVRVYEGSLNLLWFGAISDAAESTLTDNYSPLQKALSLAYVLGGATVYVPDGTYPIKDSLRIYSNTTLQLGNSATIRRDFNVSPTSRGRTIMAVTSGSTPTNITIRGGVFDGNGDLYGTDPFDIFAGTNFKKLTIENTTFKDVYGYHAIDIAVSEDVLIRNCKFLGFKGITGDTYYRESIQLDPYLNDGGAPSKRVTVDGCYFGASTTTGFGAPASGVGNHSGGGDAVGQFHKDIKIVNNIFQGCTYAGVRICNFENTLIKGNTFDSCLSGISVMPKRFLSGSSSNGDRMIIDSNSFNACTSWNIRFEPFTAEQSSDLAKFRQIVISNNVFKDSSNAPAISLSWCADVTVTGNVASNVKDFVRLEYSDHVNITGNTAKTLASNGVWAYNSIDDATLFSTNLNVSSNIFHAPGNRGVHVNGLYKNITITDNQIVNPNTAKAGIQCDAGGRSAVISNIKITGNTIIRENSSTAIGITVSTTSANKSITDNSEFTN